MNTGQSTIVSEEEESKFDVSDILWKLFIGLILAVIVYSSMFFLSNRKHLKEIFDQSDLLLLLGVLCCSLMSYIFRSTKWHFLCIRSGIHIQLKDSFQVYLAGCAFSLTPGKVGETVRAYFLKERAGVAYAKGVPICFVDRLLDLFAFSFLCLVGIFAIGLPLPYFLFIGIVSSELITLVIIILNPTILRALIHLRPLDKLGDLLLEAH